MEITVKGCEGCPFYKIINGYNYCEIQKKSEIFKSDLFATCPLKNDSLTIKLVTDEQTKS